MKQLLTVLKKNQKQELVDINAKGNDGVAAIHQAVFIHSKTIVQLLIEKGADPNTVDN